MKKTFLIAVALAAFPFAVCSQETVTLQTIIISARQSNPEIKMAQKAYLAANYAVNAETAWAAPLFGYDYMKDNGRIYIAQELSFPGKLSFKRSAVSSMARALNSRYRHKQLELDTNIKKTFWGYWLAHRKIEIFNENIALVSRFLGIAKSKYMVGKVTEADVLSASAELGRMQAMLTEAQYEADIAHKASAPASTTSRAFVRFMPPIATTGTLTKFLTFLISSAPAGFPASGFVAVENIGESPI